MARVARPTSAAGRGAIGGAPSASPRPESTWGVPRGSRQGPVQCGHTQPAGDVPRAISAHFARFRALSPAARCADSRLRAADLTEIPAATTMNACRGECVGLGQLVRRGRAWEIRVAGIGGADAVPPGTVGGPARTPRRRIPTPTPSSSDHYGVSRIRNRSKSPSVKLPSAGFAPTCNGSA